MCVNEWSAILTRKNNPINQKEKHGNTRPKMYEILPGEVPENSHGTPWVLM